MDCLICSFRASDSADMGLSEVRAEGQRQYSPPSELSTPAAEPEALAGPGPARPPPASRSSDCPESGPPQPPPGSWPGLKASLTTPAPVSHCAIVRPGGWVK